tara:strand:- start:738 stop:986 length:249 start_codon:yes stop_codon:yes gene_type:complete
MLSRKYYKKLAEIFKNGYEETYKDTYTEYGSFDCNTKANYIAQMQWALIDFLKSDNPNFNEDTFINAMNVDLPKLKKELDTE